MTIHVSTIDRGRGKDTCNVFCKDRDAQQESDPYSKHDDQGGQSRLKNTCQSFQEMTMQRSRNAFVKILFFFKEPRDPVHKMLLILHMFAFFGMHLA